MATTQPVTPRELFRDGAAPIPTVRPKVVIPQFIGHQVRPRVVDMEDHSVFRGFVREAVARQIRHNDIESIFGPTAK
jgi:hypothetical protein